MDDSVINSNTTVFLKDCHDSEYELKGYCCKVMVQNCTNCKIHVSGKVITTTSEIWHCKDVTFRLSTAMRTIQLDLNDGVDIHFDSKDHFQSVVWAGCEKVRLGFGDFVVPEGTDHHDGQGKILMGLTEIKKLYPNTDDKIDQFIVRFVANNIKAERVIRLDGGGFPTTEREAKQYDDRHEAAVQKLAEEMGITIKRKKNPNAPGRNDPCSCGSTKKYKKCCGTNE